MSIAGLLYPAERQVCLCPDSWSIHIGNTVVQLIQSAKRDVDIRGINGRRQTILHVIIDRKCLVSRRDSDDRKHRTENFLLLQSLARFDTGKNRRLKEVP